MNCFSLHTKSSVLLLLVAVAALGAVGCAGKATRGGAPSTPGTTLGGDDTGIPGTGRDQDWVPIGELKPVYFDYDKSNIRGDAAETLRANAVWIKNNPQYDIRIEGHCDNRGSDQYNMALGERRALAIREFLIGEGIDGSRLYTISYGESMPVIPNARTEAEHAKNRRGEFKGAKAR